MPLCDMNTAGLSVLLYSHGMHVCKCLAQGNHNSIKQKHGTNHEHTITKPTLMLQLQGRREGGFRKPLVKFGLLSLQQEPNILFSLATVSS